MKVSVVPRTLASTSGQAPSPSAASLGISLRLVCMRLWKRYAQVWSLSLKNLILRSQRCSSVTDIIIINNQLISRNQLLRTITHRMGRLTKFQWCRLLRMFARSLRRSYCVLLKKSSSSAFWAQSLPKRCIVLASLKCSLLLRLFLLSWDTSGLMARLDQAGLSISLPDCPLSKWKFLERAISEVASSKHSRLSLRVVFSLRGETVCLPSFDLVISKDLHQSQPTCIAIGICRRK